MFDLVISGKAVDPVDGIYNTHIGIKKGIIEKISDGGMEGKKIIYTKESSFIFPGFIDPHVHMREPGWEHKEDFLTGSQAAINGGVTTVADMPNLPEPVTNMKILNKKINLSKKSLVDVIHFGGVGNDNLDNLRQMASKVPAFKIYTAKSTGNLTLRGWWQIREAVKTITSLKRPITFHCEEQSIIDKNPKRPPEAETEAVKKVMEICSKAKATANIAHISVEESVKIVNENREKFNITCEATPHHMFFTKKDHERLGYLLKVNCPLREEKDRASLVKNLKNGSIDMLATDHAPHTLDEKLTGDYAGIPGLDTYGNFVLWLMIKEKIKPARIAEITSYNAARYFSLKKGRIKENYPADLVILDKEGNTKIKNEDMKTKCRWSPFSGMKFPGKIIHTIRNGKIAR